MMPIKPPAGIPSQFNGKTFTHAWAYRDINGGVVGYVARYDGAQDRKDCVPYFVPNGCGTFRAGGPAEPKPLYGLDALKNPGETVYIHEGEAKAAAMNELGLQSVSSIAGARSAHLSDWRPLEPFRRIVVVVDNDDEGEGYARAVVGILARLSGHRDVSIVRLPGLPQSGDIVDWIQQRVPAWDRFSPPPREPGDELVPELLDVIEKCAVPPPSDWTQSATTSDDEWGAIVPLHAAVIPPWPRNVFPPQIEAYVHALSESTETPAELPAALVLAVLATAAQGKFSVSVKPGYSEPLSLWLMCALLSGSRKTGVWQQATAPLVAYERDKRMELEPAIARATSERKTIQMRIDALRGKAARKCAAADVAGIMREIEALEYELPTVPAVPQIWGADVTPEALPVIMADNAERMSILSDEGGIIDTMAGRYSAGVPNLDVFLQGHAGSPVRVNRAGRDAVFLQNPCLSIGLCPQPDVVAKLQDKPGFRGRGLIARFLYLMPASNLGRRTLDTRPMPSDVERAYHEVVRGMLALPDDAHVLTLSPPAFASWKAFACSTEALMADGGTFAHATDWCGKLPGAVARIAAVLHIARYAHGRPWEIPISGDDMGASIRMADVLKQHALVVFDAMGADVGMDDARAILSWIRRERCENFTRRDVHKAHQSRFRRAQELDAPLEILTERGYIRQRGAQKALPVGGRPACTFDVNPVVFHIAHGAGRIMTELAPRLLSPPQIDKLCRT